MPDEKGSEKRPELMTIVCGVLYKLQEIFTEKIDSKCDTQYFQNRQIAYTYKYRYIQNLFEIKLQSPFLIYLWSFSNFPMYLITYLLFAVWNKFKTRSSEKVIYQLTKN